MNSIAGKEKPTVLLVDDDPDICIANSTRLKFCGYQTLVAKNGVEGVQMAREHCPDVIVLDVRMPEADGFTALAQLATFSETKDIPVIMLSASVVDLHRALDAGVLYFLTKPFESKDLLAAVKSGLEKKQKSLLDNPDSQELEECAK